MEKHHKNMLITAGLSVINQEGLPVPKDIIFRTGGYINRYGTMYRVKDSTDYNYRIFIYTTKAKFFPCETGKYRDKKTGMRYRKALCGEKLSFLHIVKTLAHEIAHLKFLRHDTQHKTYTDILFEKLKRELRNVI